MTAPELSVIIPAYNEEENLPPTIEVVRAALAAAGILHEFLVVDDGSRDRTREVTRELAARWGGIRLIEHGVNRGPGSGIPTGLAQARGEYIIFIPADLAIEPADLAKFVAAGRAGADVVVGLRSDRRDYSPARKLVSHVNIFLIQVLFNLRIRQFNYIHLYRRKIFERITIESRGVFLTAEVVIKARDLGYRLTEVEARYVPRERGEASCGKPSVIWQTVRDLFGFLARRW
ncbi:MAG: glycosyltransferase family 2 protein [Planctomycetes bacterium]|nr:glycosyltransferase family 2 protein [Planctomycetota bacterium]